MRKIYVSLTGGLGNQIFQLIAGLSYSENSELILITSTGEPNNNGLFRCEVERLQLPVNVKILHKKELKFIKKVIAFNLRLGLAKKNKILKVSYNKIIQAISSLILSLYLADFVIVRNSEDVGFDPKFGIGNTSSLLIGYFQSDYWLNKINQDLINRIFSLPEVNSKLDEIQEMANKVHPLIVHIRRGDYKSNDHLGLLSRSYFEASLNYHLKKSDHDEIWVFSDDPEDCFSVLPLKYSRKYRLMQDFGSDSILTLQAMRFGKAYIISNSTFSWWAASLRIDVNARVTYPKPWFKEVESPTRIGRNSWYAIESTWETQ